MDEIRYKEAPENVRRIITIVNTQSDNDAACFSRNSHAIFDDWNLGKQSIYDAMVNDEYWLEYITGKRNEGNKEHRFITLLKDVLKAIDALEQLLDFTDDELEQASDILWGIED